MNDGIGCCKHSSRIGIDDGIYYKHSSRIGLKRRLFCDDMFLAF